MKRRPAAESTRIWTLEAASGGRFAEVVRLVERGGVTILPTDTIYGLHAVATNAEAVEEIFAIKERDRGRPLAVVADDIEQLERLGVAIAPRERAFLARVWPAPLTAVLPLRIPIPASAGIATLACRVPDFPWLRRLLRDTGPLVSTSVNLSGEPAVLSVESIPDSIAQRVSAIVDAGPLGGEPSTIVEFASGEPRVLREGAANFSQNLWKTL